MKLVLNDDRAMLVIRMQAYAYENIIQGNLRKAEQIAENILRGFDGMVENNPCDEAGYWANFYLEQFKRNCEAMAALRD